MWSDPQVFWERNTGTNEWDVRRRKKKQPLPKQSKYPATAPRSIWITHLDSLQWFQWVLHRFYIRAGFPKNKLFAQKSVHISWFTCEVLGQVRVVHETVTGKLNTLQSDRHMDVIKPSGEKNKQTSLTETTRQKHTNSLEHICCTHTHIQASSTLLFSSHSVSKLKQSPYCKWPLLTLNHLKTHIPWPFTFTEHVGVNRKQIVYSAVCCCVTENRHGESKSRDSCSRADDEVELLLTVSVLLSPLLVESWLIRTNQEGSLDDCVFSKSNCVYKSLPEFLEALWQQLRRKCSNCDAF